MAQNIVWATDANILAAMLDANLSVWLCPNCVHYSDRKVIRRTRIDKESRFMNILFNDVFIVYSIKEYRTFLIENSQIL